MSSSAKNEVAAASGFAGMAAWIGGPSFSLVVGALADKVGYGPLFGCLGAFGLIGAGLLILPIRGQSRHDRAASAAAGTPGDGRVA